MPVLLDLVKIFSVSDRFQMQHEELRRGLTCQTPVFGKHTAIKIDSRPDTHSWFENYIQKLPVNIFDQVYLTGKP